MVSSGEQVTSGLLALVLQSIGIKARSWQGWQIPLHTDAAHRAARITGVAVDEIKARMTDGEVAVIAGFQGIAPGNRISTLGRGGSDTSAVALAAALAADRCDIYTDVDGVYTTDPRVVPKAHRLDRISYEEMLEMASQGAKVLQTRSVELAMQQGVRVLVRSSFDPPDLGGRATEDALELGTLVCHEDEIVEQNVVSGIAYARDEAKVTLLKVADKPGVAAQVFGPLAEANINVDMIVQNVSEDGRFTDLTFTVQSADLDRALEVLRKAKENRLFRLARFHRHRQGVGDRRRHAEPRRRCRANVQCACRKGHQYRGDLDIRDQDQRVDRRGLRRACGADLAFLVRFGQPLADFGGKPDGFLTMLGPPLRRPARTDSMPVFCWRPETVAAPLARGDGGARERAGAARQGGGADRLQHGGGGVLALSAPPRRLARTVRHRRPQPGPFTTPI